MYGPCLVPILIFSLLHIVKPNHATFTLTLLACAETASLQQGRQIQEALQSSGLPIDKVLATASITLYAKSGDTENANKVCSFAIIL